MNEPSVIEARKSFDAAVCPVFAPQDPSSHPLFVFVARTLKQFRLSQAYEPGDILAEAYTRGIKQIEDGRPIHSPLAWFRRTSIHVMLEFRRKQKDSPSPLLDDPVSETSCNTVSVLLFQEDLSVVKHAFEQLDPESQMLLHHRLIQGQSWREVSQALATAGGPELNESTLRQRGFKAMKKLRQLYEKTRLEITVEWVDNPETIVQRAED